jgi:outer membrane protein TolC
MKKFMSLFSNKERNHFPFQGLFLLFLLSAFPSAGQPFMSLDEALALGMINNYSIRVARNDSAIATSEVTFGNAGMLPSLNAYGNWDKASLDAKARTMLGGSIDRKGAAVNTVSAGLQLHWTLFDGTAMFLEYDKLKSHAELTTLQLRNKVENTVFDIIASYYDITRQKLMVKACEKKLETSNLRLSVARSKFQSGLGSEQELLQAEVIHLSDTTALVRQQTMLKSAEISLNKLLAIDLQHGFTVEDTIPLVSLPPLQQLTGNALRTNSIYLQAGEVQKLNLLDVKLLRSKQMPTLTLRGAYAFAENKTDAALINYTRTLGPSVGINATVNIFDGWNLTRKIKQAKLELENQGIRIRELEQELLAAVLDAWLEHQNLLQSVELGRKGIALAKKNMDIAGKAFVSGTASSLQLREAQEDLFRADADLLEALYQARMIEIALLKISGELVKTGKQGY